MREVQGSLFDSERERKRQILDEVRSSLDRAVPEYKGRARLVISDDDDTYLQPRADYNIIVLLRGVPDGELERIADSLPKRSESDGLVYAVHVKDEDAYVEEQIKARDL